MQEMARSKLIAVLRETGGRISGTAGAAELLDVKPTTLYSRIKKFKITEADWS